MRVLVYLPEEKLAPKGGPFAVGYYYYEEMKKRGEHTLEFTHVDQKYEDTHRKGRSITSKLPSWLNNLHRTARGISHRKDLLNGKLLAPVRDFNEYDIIHFHQADHFYLERENLKDYKGIVIYQSHSPLPWGQEQCKDISKWYDRCIPHMAEEYEEIDKWCFERADYIVFPCSDAEEPYVKNWPYYATIQSECKERYKYILTGIMPAFAKIPRADVLKQYGIPNDGFVISYVGRHNTVKGFDILKEIASQYFSEDPNAWVVSAGQEAPFKRLSHERWKEIGFTNDPHSLISASDVFVLPNRVTYFDIVMIEILSLGKIVIASRTGGNKYFEKQGLEGVLLYDTVEEAVELLRKVKTMPAAKRKELEKKNHDFYVNHLSSTAMYDSYMAMLQDVYCRKK